MGRPLRAIVAARRAVEYLHVELANSGKNCKTYEQLKHT